MKKLYLTVLVGLIVTTSWAQYDRSAGVRLGSSSGFTFKKFIHEEEAFELLLSGRNDGLQLTGTYQFHKPLNFNFSDRFYLNYGAGGHFGYESRRRILHQTDPFGRQFINDNHKEFTMGVDGIIGIEYRWLKVPITFGLDIKPYFDFIGMRTARFRFWDSAITARYIF